MYVYVCTCVMYVCRVSGRELAPVGCGGGDFEIGRIFQRDLIKVRRISMVSGFPAPGNQFPAGNLPQLVVVSPSWLQ